VPVALREGAQLGNPEPVSPAARVLELRLCHASG
jgi:hypothetical protein